MGCRVCGHCVISSQREPACLMLGALFQAWQVVEPDFLIRRGAL